MEEKKSCAAECRACRDAERSANKKMKIAVLGMGTIGSGLVDALTENRDAVAAACGKEIEIKYILEIRDFPGHPLEDKIVHDIGIILNDAEIELAAEMMGGSHPAYDYTSALLRAGKHVVTSNKEVVANFGDELTRLALENNVHYLFEASVCGGIPLIRPITHSLSSEKINQIDGIVNGTTNYILTEIERGGKDFESALESARALGYAESNPNADINSIDAQRKIVILTALATGKLYPTSEICTESICGVTSADIASAAKLGGSIKLIAHASFNNSSPDIFAAPCFVPYSSPLAHISGVYNGVLIDASVSGDLMFFGQGAGKYPTAGSVMSDITAIASGIQGRIKPFIRADKSELTPADEHICRHFLSVPAEISGKAADIFGISDAPVLNYGTASFILPECRHGAAVYASEALTAETGARVALYRII